jgi:hypothetical protein
MNTIAQSKILIDYIIIALAPLVDAEARREISNYFATLDFKSYARRPRSPRRGKMWRNRSLWRPEGHAATRKLEEIRADKS